MLGKLNRIDEELGWSLLPNRSLERRVEPGLIIKFVTDRNGIRIDATGAPDAVIDWKRVDGQVRRRVLIVGDSFVEGLVDFEDRFDRIVAARRPEWAILAVGCQGYGTDQEVLLARRHVRDLRAGDVLVLVTCGNDFHDILRDRYFARSKQWFEIAGDSLLHHPPRIGVRERVRDASYIATRLALRFSRTRSTFTEEEVGTSRQLYLELVTRLSRPLRGQGIHMVIAHHSNWMSGDNSDVIATVCRDEGVHELALDPTVIGVHREKNENLLRDGVHWSARGNAVVADTLEGYLAELLR